MRLSLVILAIAVGVCAGSSELQGNWKKNNEYRYLVESRTLATLNNEHQQSAGLIGEKPLHYTGVLLRARLALQPYDDDTIRGRITVPRYAQLHTEFQRKDGDWNDVEIQDSMLNFQPLPMSTESFEIKMKKGVVNDVVISKNMPTWEVNILKSIVSQLQVDTTGENAKRKDEDPEDENSPYGTFKVMEDTVTGKCEVMYDVAPLDESSLQKHPELVPLPELVEQMKGQPAFHMEIVKTKNYERCQRRAGYHFGIEGATKWEPGANDNGRLLSKIATSRIVVTGTRKSFIIQSSVTTNKVFISPRVRDDQLALVQSRMNLTLSKVTPVQDKIEGPRDPQVVGSLVYSYNEPFGDQDRVKNRKQTQEGYPALNDDTASNSEEDSLENLKTSSWEDDTEYWQANGDLTDPPETPLLPLFVGYKGKSIASKISPVRLSRDLVHQIAVELPDTNKISEKQTLEKFSILGDVLRTMTYRQIIDASADYNAKNPKTKDSWAVFRDAVIQAGTGPALLAIRDWIAEDKMEPKEIISLMAYLPNTVRNPTPEYIKELFSIATNHKVVAHPAMRSAAILAFAELVRRADVDQRTAHNRFPVHSFGRFIPRSDRTVVEKYIPYLSNQLKEAMQEGNSVMSQTYVMALGRLAHPAILSAYEPYLEGRMKTTKFMRLLMVTSMSKLTEVKPKLARSILYRIYSNTMEAHEIRCAAVYLLMKTDPPLPMLQRMAEFTHHDTSQHVSSAVKSTIESIAELNSPSLRKLTEKAQIARDALTMKDFDVRYSHSYIMDSESFHDSDDEEDGVDKHLAYRLIMNYIGSEDGFPMAWYFGLSNNGGGFQMPTQETVAMVSNVAKLLHIFSNNNPKDTIKMKTDEIADLLGIVDSWRTDEPLEGNLFVQNKYGSAFFAFDENILNQLQDLYKSEKGKLSQTEEEQYESMKLVNYEVDIGFPTETGLPFIFSTKIPTYVKMSLQTRQPRGDSKFNFNLGFINSRKIQTRAGFVTPFDHQEFIVGVDTDMQVYVPGLEVIGRTSSKEVQRRSSVEIKLHANGKKGAHKALHYSVIPFTARRDILDETPIALSKNIHIIRHLENERAFKIDPRYGPVTIDYKGENLLGSKQTPDPLNIHILLDNEYKNLEVYLNEQAMGLTLTLEASMEEVNDQKELKSDGKPEATFNGLKEMRDNWHERKLGLLKIVPKGIKSPVARVTDLEVKLVNTDKSFSVKQILSLAMANSGIDKKSRTLIYWRGELNDNMQKGTLEVCANVQAVRENVLDERSMMMAALMPTTHEQPIRDVLANIRFGAGSCMNGREIVVKGKQWQSEELKKKLQKAVRKCEEARDMEEQDEHHTMSRIEQCEKIGRLAMAMDHLKLVIDMDENAARLTDLVDKAVDSARNVWSSTYDGLSLTADDEDNEENGDINISLKMDSDFKSVDVVVATGTNEPVTFHNLPLGELGGLDDASEGTCVLEDKRAMTFDGKGYRMEKIDDCTLVAMTTYSKNDLPIPADKKVSITKRATKNDREANVILGEHTISFKFNKNDKSMEVRDNGKTVKLSPNQSYRKVEDDTIQFEIYRVKENTVALTSNVYDIKFAFDGERILVKADDEFRDSVRGLCGNYDGNPDNDFRTPMNCAVRLPKLFIPSYALIKDNCQDRETIAIATRQKQQVCQHATLSPPYNMIKTPKTDMDGASHGHQACNTHANKYIFLEDEICFTTRAIPACRKGCQPKEVRSKKFQLFCMSKNSPAAQEMKRKIDQGRRPDLSEKPSSRSWPFDVPVGCHRPAAA